MKNDYKSAALMVRGRVLDLPDIYYPKHLPDIYKHMMTDLKEMVTHGGLLILPFDKRLERAARIMLSFFSGKMKELGVLSRYDIFADTKIISLPEPGSVFWLFHEGLSSNPLMLRLEEWLKPGRAAIISTSLRDFSRVLYKFPSRVNNGLNEHGRKYLEDFESMLNAELEKDKEDAKKDPNINMLFSRVCSTDQWGVPVPVDLLREACSDINEDFDQVLQGARELELVFSTHDPAEALTSKGPPWASGFINLSEIDCKKFYENILTLINGSRKEHLSFALSLFQAWLARSSQGLGSEDKALLDKKAIIDLFQVIWPKIDKLNLQESDLYQVLAWSQVAADLNEFQKAVQLINSAMQPFDSHPHLIHQKAHLYLSLAQKSWAAEDIRMAEKAINEAVHELPGNVYVLHSQGIFEGCFGKKDKALKAFEKITEQQPWNAYAQTAKADLYLDKGMFEKTEEVLDSAWKAAASSFCLDHLQGRLFFYQGFFDKAKSTWESMLTNYNDNIYALQSLGHMARKRGRWAEALVCLDKAYKNDPESSPVLLEIAMVLADLALYLERSGLDQPVAETREALSKTLIFKNLELQDLVNVKALRLASLKVLSKAVEIDPLNLRLRIQEIIISIRSSEMDKADQELTRLEISHPGNVHVLAARAMWHEQNGQPAHALSYYRIAASKDRYNPELKLKLAGVLAATDNEEEVRTVLDDISRYIEARESEISAHVRMSLLVEYAGLARHISAELRMDASQAIEKARTIDPENPWTRIYE